MSDEVSQEKNEEWLTGTIPLNIAGKDVAIKVNVPAASVKPRRLLPVFQRIADAIIDVAVKTTEEKGKSVSCKAGCAACCRQLVPIGEIEAVRLQELVEQMSEADKGKVKTRFADALEKLNEAGLLEKLRNLSALSINERKEVANEYFRLQIECPFLENESCTIYPDRPIACREYLVTSPVKNCFQPKDNIEGVDLPAKVSAVVFSLDSENSSIEYKWMPLIFALNWEETNEEDSQMRTGPEWVDEVVNRLTKN